MDSDVLVVKLLACGREGVRFLTLFFAFNDLSLKLFSASSPFALHCHHLIDNC